jgi:hypothetical protein
MFNGAGPAAKLVVGENCGRWRLRIERHEQEAI